MKYHIERAYRIRFSLPAREHHIQIRLTPWHDANQSLVRIRLCVRPDAAPVAAYDGFGNLAHHFAVLGAHEELDFSLEADVETRRDNPFDFEPISPRREMEWIARSLREAPRLWDFVLHRGVLTPALPDEINGHPIPGFRADRPLIHQVQDAMAWTRAIAQYDPDRRRPVADLSALFDARRGTADDLAHLLIAVVRRWSVPARFVSGYLDAGYFDADPVSSGARRLHHWAEVLIPGAGWLGFDPALDLLADSTYVRVAAGRDGRDIQELRQSCKEDGMIPELDERLSISRVSG